MAAAGSLLTSSGLTGLVIPQGKLNATAAANALTISVTFPDGTAPSPTAPLLTAVQSSTSGLWEARYITAALSITLPNGSPCNPGGSVSFRNWVGLFDNGGVPTLAVEWCSNGFGVYSLPDGDLASASAAGGAFSLYATSTITNQPFRVIGYLEWTSGLASTAWSADPDIKVLRNVGTKLPGEIVQRSFNNIASYQSFVANIPFDDTIPATATEGASYFNVPITARSPVNMLLHEYEATLARSTAGPLIIAISKGGTGAAIATETLDAGADKPMKIKGSVLEGYPTTSSVNYAMNFGATGGATIYLNGNSGGRLFGGSLRSLYSISEIMG